MKNRFFSATAFLLATVLLYSCSKDDSNKVQPPKGAYSDGLFILNEGWFGHEIGSVNFYGYGQDSIITGVYARENGNTAPSVKGATLENGLIFNDRLYMISKVGGPIVVADANTMKGLGSIQMDKSDFRDIATLDDQNALVSTNDGILALNLGALTLNKTAVAGEGSAVKGLLYADSHLYASSNGGVDIYNPTNWTLEKHYDGPTEGYARTPDGTVYGASGKLLIAINPTTLDTTQIVLTQAINSNDFAYTKAALVASSKDNSVYYVAASTSYTPNIVFKYEKGNTASAQQPFITLPTGEQFYGAGIGYDQKNNMIVTTSITGYGEDDINYLHFYDAETGALKQTVSYGHPYFPATLVFHP